MSDKKNKIEWVSHYEVTNFCCNPMEVALSHEHLVVRSHQPGITEPDITTNTKGSWYPFKFCPWCSTEL
jgi:hypothetical protein